QYDEFNVTEDDKKAYAKYMEGLSDKQKEMLANLPNAYLVEFRNIGGVVMPLIVELEFQDGTKEVRRIPAEIWRRDNRAVSKMFITEKPVKQITLDPRGETADSSVVNNYFPRRIETKSVDLNSNFINPRRGRGGRDNPMRRALRPKDDKAEGQAEEKKDEAGTSGSDGS
ncbi:MAG: hypothetical protein P8J33_04270, partial [Pirellulaceae bacterium]|nr:hypothetical protein [Pirellulaceae bacterium]